MWLPGRTVARAAGRHLPAGATLRVRGSRAAARSVARWLLRRGFAVDPELPGIATPPTDALVLLGRFAEGSAEAAAVSLRDGGRLVVCQVRPMRRRHAMKLTAWLAQAGFVGVGQRAGGGLLPVHVTFGTLRRLPE